MISDNGPEFDNQKFKNFSTDWHFEHWTLSPRYPKANGKVENAVKTCKGLLLKAKEDKQDIIGDPRMGATAKVTANCWQVTPAKQLLEDHSEKPGS